jgi:hypothetical protein
VIAAMEETMATKLIGIAEAAAILGRKVGAVYGRVHRRTIPVARRRGQVLWFQRTDVLATAQRDREAADRLAAARALVDAEPTTSTRELSRWTGVATKVVQKWRRSHG